MAKAETTSKTLVRIHGRQEVRYDQQREVSDETLKELRSLLRKAVKGDSNAGREFDAIGQGLLDLRDVWDADDMEDVEVEVQGANGKWKSI